MGKFIRVLTLIYDKTISFNEITSFRGAVVKIIGGEANILYHNHLEDDKYRYSYPLIQYKRLRGHAAIVCIEEGADVIGQFLSENNKTLNISGHEMTLKVEKVKPARLLVQTWNNKFKYNIFRWTPLNAQNYKIYNSLNTDEERIGMLEKILKGNLLSMLKGLGIHLENELNVKITNISAPYITYNKKIGFSTFNADFTSNLTIPNNIGIGKNASIGYGIVKEIKISENNSNNNNDNNTTINEEQND